MSSEDHGSVGISPSEKPSPSLDGASKSSGERLKRALACFAGPWRPEGAWIWGRSLKGGANHVADVRGWGYLTGHGHGALALDGNEAKEIQNSIGHLLAAAPDLLNALKMCVIERGEWLEEARAAIAKAEGSQHVPDTREATNAQRGATEPQ